jgi:hypothetical protein
LVAADNEVTVWHADGSVSLLLCASGVERVCDACWRFPGSWILLSVSSLLILESVRPGRDLHSVDVLASLLSGVDIIRKNKGRFSIVAFWHFTCATLRKRKERRRNARGTPAFMRPLPKRLPSWLQRRAAAAYAAGWRDSGRRAWTVVWLCHCDGYRLVYSASICRASLLTWYLLSAPSCSHLLLS